MSFKKSRFTTLLLVHLVTVVFLSGQKPLEDSVFSSLKVLRQNVDSLEHPRTYIFNYRIKAEKMNDSLDHFFDLLAKAEKMSLELTDSFQILPIYGARGRFYLERGEYANAVREFTTALDFFGVRDSAHIEQEGWFSVGYGNLLYRIELYQDAITYYEQALIKFQHSKANFGRTVAYNNIGLSYLRLNQANKALGYFWQSYQIRKEVIGDRFFVAHSQLHLAKAYLQTGEFAKADSLLLEAEQFAQSATKPEFKKDVFHMWSKLALQLGDMEKAKTYLDKAIQDQSGFFNNLYNAEILNTYCELYLAEGQLDSAFYYAKKGASLAEKNQQKILERQFLQKMIDIYEKSGNEAGRMQLLERLDKLNQNSLAEKNKILEELLRSKQKLFENREKVKLLELRNRNQSNTISYQRWVLLLSLSFAVLALIGLIAFYRLNRKLHKTDNKLRDLIKRTTTVANALDNAIISLNRRGQIRYFNDSALLFFQNVYGITLNEGRELFSLFESEKIQSFWKARFAKAENTASWQEVVQEGEGENSHHFIQNYTQISVNGTFKGLAVVITNFSENYRQNLQLALKSKELEKALHTKDRMISLLAHDLKEGVLSSLELTEIVKNTESQQSAGELKEYLMLINNSLSKTKTLLFKTLEWVQNQKAGARLNNLSFYPYKLVEDVIGHISTQAAEKGIKLENNIEPNLKVEADPEIIRTVIRNLLNNALKFTHAQKGIIRLESERQENGKVTLHVKDNGIGIEPSVLERILSTQQSFSSKGTNGEIGTGIGLQLCQELLALQGSALQVVSEKQRGSDFSFSLSITQN